MSVTFNGQSPVVCVKHLLQALNLPPQPLLHAAVPLVTSLARHQGVALRQTGVVMVSLTVLKDRMKMDATDMTSPHSQTGKERTLNRMLISVHQNRSRSFLQFYFPACRPHTPTPSPLKTPSMAAVTLSTATPTVRKMFDEHLFQTNCIIFPVQCKPNIKTHS